MSSQNQKTLKAYEKHADLYAQSRGKVLEQSVKKNIHALLKGIAKDAKIFEVGSGIGLDAQYMMRLGYRNVVCSDAANSFIQMLQSNGLDAKVFDATKDNFESVYDIIYANAVIVHFTRNESIDFFTKAFRALSENGRLSISTQEGSGDSWQTNKMDGAPRYFAYWSAEDIERTLKLIGFAQVDVVITSHPVEGRPNWLNVIAVKYSNPKTK